MLSEQQLNHYHQQGYLILHEFFSDADIKALQRSALAIVEDFDEDSTRSFFSTKTDTSSRDEYFLTSDDKVRCFYEEDAFDADGNLVRDKALCINKIGHALHTQDAVFNQFCQKPEIANIAKSLGQRQPEIRQSMYIFKQPKIGGIVRWHQDATYFLTQPSSVITFWIAIEDANRKNGCLMVKPNTGQYPLIEQFKRFKDNTTSLESLDSTPWPPEEDAVPLEVTRGSLIVFNGQLPHFSHANTSSKSRHAVTLHITCGSTAYDTHNWLRAEPMPIG
ncbi:MAG: phytanoyl-CoA dioxygenase family protein [Pseudomonadota bacterium]